MEQQSMVRKPLVSPSRSPNAYSVSLMEEEHRTGSLSSPMQRPSSPQNRTNGVETCYVFKSRLQEYAQKVGFPTPVYQTVKEGPSHEPIFKSTVIVNDVKYDSLPGFFNRKAAEQSAAEIALTEIHKSGQMTESIPTVHETGLCKNLLQEYAQKMNYAIPSYKWSKQEDGAHPFICTVEIGSIQYIGAAARTKKEAEIKAARTALLAIQYGSKLGANGTSQYSVLPCKKKSREKESQSKSMEQLKPKKPFTKKKWLRRRFPRKRGDKEDNFRKSDTLNPVEKMDGVEKEDLRAQINELKASSVEINGGCKDEKQDRLVRGSSVIG